jgi:hypothetical protein
MALAGVAAKTFLDTAKVGGGIGLLAAPSVTAMTLVAVGPKFELPEDGNCGGDCSIYVLHGGGDNGPDLLWDWILGKKPQTPDPDTPPIIEGARKRTPAIRREWEKSKEKKWPKDKNGNNFDADHKKAKADGGSDHTRNIQPRKHTDHINRHKKNGDFRRWAKRAHRKNKN